jgi:diguanylate cyclase
MAGLASLLTKAMASAANAMFITDREGRIVWVNAAFVRLSGYSEKEAIGQTPRFLQSGVQTDEFYKALWSTIVAGKAWRGEVVDRHKDGHLYTIDEVVTPLRDENGAVTHFLAVQHDVTLRKEERERDHFLAYHDALTGLPNRSHFLGVVEKAIADARRKATGLALLFLDLDHFKSVNDNLGHHIGDQLLIAVTERLNAAVRKTDVVARLSGDEFAVLQTGGFKSNVVAALATKLLDVIAKPFVIDGHTIRVGVSIGAVLYPAGGEDAQTLLKNADSAMYEAKHRGRNTYVVYGATDAG